MKNISVNGVAILEQEIAAEIQHHPADTLEEARNLATQALVVRQLLLQEAARLGIASEPMEQQNGNETEEEALIRGLLEREIKVPEADDPSCMTFFKNNAQRFRSPDLFEAAHILFAAPVEDEDARRKAETKAKAAISRLQDSPGDFARLAETLSDCTSAKQGGSLGQIAQGDTVPEFETFLMNLEESQLCPIPVATRFGYHVIRLDKRIEGKQLPFEAVKEKVAVFLTRKSWQRAVSQYLKVLASRAEIAGIEIEGAESPLVQ